MHHAPVNMPVDRLPPALLSAWVALGTLLVGVGLALLAAAQTVALRRPGPGLGFVGAGHAVTLGRPHAVTGLPHKGLWQRPAQTFMWRPKPPALGLLGPRMQVCGHAPMSGLL